MSLPFSFFVGIYLQDLGITDAERAELAVQYPVGKTLWRSPITHFTPWDCNWPYGPPLDAGFPPEEEPKDEKKEEDPCEESGCVIKVESQVLGEDFSVVGTPFSLHYRSDRVAGRKAGRVLDISLSGSSVPASLQGIGLTIRVAGRVITHSFPAAPNQSYTFLWDGKDAYGRELPGAYKAQVSVNYVYRPVYYGASPNFIRSFAFVGRSAGSSGTLKVIGRRSTAANIVVRRLWKKTLTAHFQNGSTHLGGISLNVHHAYAYNHSAQSGTLSLGNGSVRGGVTNTAKNSVISTVAGTIAAGYSGDDGSATEASLDSPHGIAVGSDGSIYIADTANNRIRKVNADGTITTVAGTGARGYSGDGGLATAADLNLPRGIAVGSDSAIYIADTYNHRIRKVDPNGIITTVAGTGAGGYSGDGGLAIATDLSLPRGIAVGPDGTIYIADTGNRRIRKVSQDGTLYTVAGSGQANSTGDGGSALGAGFISPRGVALGPDGALFVLDAGRSWGSGSIRKIDPDGVITRVTGSTQLRYPQGMAVASDGTIYIADNSNHRIRRIAPGGIMTTVAGGGESIYSGDGFLARSSYLWRPSGVAISPDGTLYISERNRIRHIHSAYPEFAVGDNLVSSEEGDEIYLFDSAGRHHGTLNALTDAIIYTFGYDGNGYLVSITDADANVTIIERDANGLPSAMVSPDGQRTSIGLDQNGYLQTLANPAGETHRMEYSADGLLTRYTDPRGQDAIYHYDALGRLIRDEAPNGGGWLLNRTDETNGYSVSMTSGEGRVSTYQVNALTTGDTQRTVTKPDGSIATALIKTDSERVITAADGSTTSLVFSSDPRFGMQSPVPIYSTMTTPGGLTKSQSNRRSAALASTGDLSQLTETTTINGKTSTRQYDVAAKRWSYTSAENRTASVQVNEKGDPVLTRVTGLNAVDIGYDSRGRLDNMTSGSGVDARSVSFSYDPLGNLETITDALNRTVQYEHDLAGRVTKQVLPDGREIGYNYDANGNLTSLTPPGRPEHIFNYNAADLAENYVPPSLPDITTPATRYDYNLDKQLTRVTRPDGQQVDLNYDAVKGHLTTLSIPRGNYSYSYNPGSGYLQEITSPDNGTLGFTYDGPLLINTTWSGEVAGTVSRTWNNDFRIESRSVNGAYSITQVSEFKFTILR